MRHGVEWLHLIVGGEDAVALAGGLARRLGYLAVDSRCSAIVGTDLVEVPAAPLAEPGRSDGTVPEVVAPLAELLRDAGLEVIVEGGVVRGEVLGLEVARVAVEDGDAVLGVGVGRFDREITAMLHADLPDAEAVERAATIVREHRYPGAPPHPLMSMGRARWLRAVALCDPAIVELAELVAVGTTVEPPNLRDLHPAAALGRDRSGREVVAVFSAGIDLDLVTLAADTRARHAPDAELLLVVPAGDRLAPLVAVGDELDVPPRWLEIPPPWAAAG